MQIDKITIEGYKSIKSLRDFELKNINILIGANGVGKSNFISAFISASKSIPKIKGPIVFYTLEGKLQIKYYLTLNLDPMAMMLC